MKSIIGAVLLVLIAGHVLAEGDAVPLWRRSYFDGVVFREGVTDGVATVYTRDGYLPFIEVDQTTPPNDRLAKGQGALVVYCFLQSSGGKLKSHSGTTPVAGVAVEIRADQKIISRADGNGYLVLALPAGEYTVTAVGMTRKAKIEKSKTLLLPIRVGKRMVD